MSKYRRYNHDNGEIMFVYKQTSEGVLCVNGTSIDLHQNLSFDDYFTIESGHKPTTKKVFDKMYNETINRLNKLK